MRVRLCVCVCGCVCVCVCVCVCSRPPAVRFNGNPRRNVWHVHAARCMAQVLCGSMKREVMAYDSGMGRRLFALSSEIMTAIPSRNAVHPSLPLICAGTNSGRLHIWRAQP